MKNIEINQITIDDDKIRANSSALLNLKSHIYLAYSKLYQKLVDVDDIEINSFTFAVVLEIMKHVGDFDLAGQEDIKERISSYVDIEHGLGKVKYNSYDEIEEAIRSLDSEEEA